MWKYSWRLQQSKFEDEFSPPGGNDAEQECEEILLRLKFIIFRNILIKFYYSLIWLPILSFIV